MGFFDSIGDLASSVVATISDGASDVINGAGDFTSDVLNGATTTILDGVSIVGGGASDVWDGAGNVLDGAGNVLDGAGNTIVDGARDVWDGAGNFLDGAGNTIVDGASFVGGGASDFFNDGIDIIAGTANNLYAFMSNVGEFVAGFFDGDLPADIKRQLSEIASTGATDEAQKIFNCLSKCADDDESCGLGCVNDSIVLPPFVLGVSPVVTLRIKETFENINAAQVPLSDLNFDKIVAKLLATGSGEEIVQRLKSVAVPSSVPLLDFNYEEIAKVLATGSGEEVVQALKSMGVPSSIAEHESVTGALTSFVQQKAEAEYDSGATVAYLSVSTVVLAPMGIALLS